MKNNTLVIINHLAKEYDKTPTMHQLALTLNIPYASFYRTIQDMKDLVHITTVGKAKTLQLNIENPVIISYLAIASEEEKKTYLKRKPLINAIHKELHTQDAVLLFGSYADGTESEKSDIDLIIINKQGDRTIAFSKQELIFQKTINPLFFTNEEFSEMITIKGENVGKQAVKKHVILNNPERFWGLVIHALRKRNI